MQGIIPWAYIHGQVIGSEISFLTVSCNNVTNIERIVLLMSEPLRLNVKKASTSSWRILIACFIYMFRNNNSAQMKCPDSSQCLEQGVFFHYKRRKTASDQSTF